MSSIFMMAFAASYPAASVYVGIATALALVGDQVWDPRRRWQRAAMAASNLALEALVTTNDARRLKRQLDIIMSTEREFFATLFAIDAMVNGLPKRNAAEIVR
ncbi:MAG: hypothetical protein Q8P41_01325 [Pseudomonadota bacterium]|nr:hypothetical protein [Pseudomonadota bacterium]